MLILPNWILVFLTLWHTNVNGNFWTVTIINSTFIVGFVDYMTFSLFVTITWKVGWFSIKKTYVLIICFIISSAANLLKLLRQSSMSPTLLFVFILAINVVKYPNTPETPTVGHVKNVAFSDTIPPQYFEILLCGWHFPTLRILLISNLFNPTHYLLNDGNLESYVGILQGSNPVVFKLQESSW